MNAPRCILTIALLAATVACGANSRAGSHLTRDRDPQQDTFENSADTLGLRGLLARTVERNGGYGGGILRVESGGDVLVDLAVGTRIFGQPEPIAPTDTFEIASTTKAFAAALTMTLVEDGLLTLDTAIGDVLPAETVAGLLVIDGADLSASLTIRQLLGHTSGLPDYWLDPPFLYEDVNPFLDAFINDSQHTWTPPEILDQARRLTPIGPPDAQWHYGDTGYVLVGLAIEAVTGQPFDVALRERILDPLGMGDTYLTFHEEPTSPYPESHRYEWNLDLHGRPHQSADWVGGGLVSSTRDLATFVRAVCTGTLFDDPATAEQMRDWVYTGEVDVFYGLGLFRLVLDDDLGELWGHDGYGGAFAYYWPERDTTFTGTLNQADSDWWPLVEAAIIAME